jgi:hypothetical protein
MESGNKTIISALVWVDRGYAKAQLEEYEPNDEEMAKHQQMEKKLLKGKTEVDNMKAAQTMQENIMDGMDMDDYDNDENEAPIFTSELATLIEKEKKGVTGKDKKAKKEKGDKDKKMDEDDDYMSDPDA